MEQTCTTCGAPTSNRKCDDCGEHIGRNRNNKLIFIAIVVTFSLISVGAFLIFGPLFSFNQNAFQLFQQSTRMMNTDESMMIDFYADTEITTVGLASEIPMTGRVYTEVINETEMHVMMEMETTAFGRWTDMTMVFRDGYIYTDLSGEKSRESISLQDAFDEIAYLTMLDIYINEDEVISSSVERMTEGYRLTFDLDATAMLYAMGEYAEGLYMADIEDHTFTLTVDLDHHNQQVASTMEIEIEFMEMNMPAHMHVSMRAEVVQVGEVTVSLPDWIDAVAAIQFVDPADAPFLGKWHEGFGVAGLFIFMEADSVEFLPDGTVIITENEIEETAFWTLDTDEILRIAGREFSWEIENDTLTITDSWETDWVFRRVD